MAKDDETGIDPKATDGQPNGKDDAEMQREMDELAAARAKKGAPIDDQQPADEEEQPELFPIGTVPGDPKVTHKNLIRPGTSIKTECALSRAAVPLTGGLHAYGSIGEVLVTFEAGKVSQIPEFGERQADGSRKLKGVKLVQELSAVHVRDGAGMFALDQVLDILEGSFGIPRTADKVVEVFGLGGPSAAAGA